MSNYLVLAIVVLTAAPILFGVLLGLLRGSRRALLRLILVLLSIILAAVLCGRVTNEIVNLFSEENMSDIVSSLPLINVFLEILVDLELNIILQSLLQIVMFLLLFFGFWFLSWAIIFPLCKIFVKPKKVRDSNGVVKTKKRSWLGAIFGFVQGVAVAVAICVVATGFVMQANNVINTAAEVFNSSEGEVTEGSDVEARAIIVDEESVDGEVADEQNINVIAMIRECADSGICKMYDKIGAKLFDKLSEVTLEDGTTVTLSVQVDKLRDFMANVKDVINLFKSDFGNDLTSFRGLFNALGKLPNGFKTAFQTIIRTAIDMGLDVDLPIDISTIDLTSIDFAKEGEIFETLYRYTENYEELTVEDAKNAVKQLAESDILYVLMEKTMDGSISDNIPQEQRSMIAETLNELESEGNISQEKLNSLRKIFGITNSALAVEWVLA